jgi:hypothetical protein
MKVSFCEHDAAESVAADDPAKPANIARLAVSVPAATSHLPSLRRQRRVGLDAPSTMLSRTYRAVASA